MKHGKELIAAAQTAMPSVNAETTLLPVGEGTTCATWRQEQMLTQVLEAQPVYTGPERFSASLMKHKVVPCPPSRTGETMIKGGDGPHRLGVGERGLRLGRHWEQRKECSHGKEDRAAPRKPQPRQQTGQRAPWGAKSCRARPTSPRTSPTAPALATV